MSRYSAQHLLFAALLWNSTAVADDEFNTDFIHGAHDDKAVSKALTDGLNQSAIYSVQINGKPVGGYYFTRQGSRLIFKQKFISALSPLLKDDLLKNLQAEMALNTASKRYQVSEDPQNSQLSLWIKDEDMREDNGDALIPFTRTLNALLMNYTASASYYRDKTTGESSTTLPFTSHMQLGLFDFPISLDLSSQDLIHDSIDVDNASISHLLPAIKSEVTVGQTYTSSRYDEGFSFTGVQMNSVDDLFSRRERFYSPRITGFARTNATVEVYQGTRLLYTKTVAAGNFSIDQVQGVSNQTLRVVVKESDGTQHVYQYENTVIPGLLTPGTWNYQVNAGKYRYGDNSTGDAFSSFEYSYGFALMTSTLSSVISQHYKNATAGVALPLHQFGALGVAASGSSFNHEGRTHTGQSYSVNYAKYVGNAFNIQLAGYRYSTHDYYTFREAMDASRLDLDAHQGLRNRFTATVMTREPLLGNQVSMNFMRSNYWGNRQGQNTYSLFYGGMAWRANYNISLSRSWSTEAKADTSLSLYISIPFGESSRSAYTRMSSDAGGNNIETGVNGYSDKASWAASTSHSTSSNSNTLAGSYNTWNDRVSAQANASVGTDSSYASGSLGGSLALADGHFTFSNAQSTTMALVKLEGGKNASINGVTTQNSGYALVPLNESYAEQDVTLDVSSMKNTLMIDKPQVRVRPKKGSIVLVDFTVKHVKYLRAILLGQDGEPLSFGAHVLTSEGDEYYAGNGGGFLMQRVMIPGKPAKSLILKDPDSGCHWTIAGKTIAAHRNEDFINAGQLPCKKH
ncbi:fimbrial biogenesis outer membrane usher protein [Enterobacteriaceae bacterium 89]|nr:fimbrial biogenesis outer membrane usher protein [Enterobacteriaceae bacterium 89]